MLVRQATLSKIPQTKLGVRNFALTTRTILWKRDSRLPTCDIICRLHRIIKDKGCANQDGRGIPRSGGLISKVRNLFYDTPLFGTLSSTQIWGTIAEMNAHGNNSTQSDDNYAKQIIHRSGFTEARKPSSSGLLLYDRHIHHVGTSEPSIGFLEICLFMLRPKPQAVKCVATEQVRL